MSLWEFLKMKGYHRIKLSKAITGHYKFDLELNGVLGTFILDTGASNTCVDFDSIEKYHLIPKDSEVKAAGAGAIDMLTKIAFDNILQVKNWVVNDVEIVLFDLSHVNQALTNHKITAIDGIIGADILSKAKAVIDYERGCLYLLDVNYKMK